MQSILRGVLHRRDGVGVRADAAKAGQRVLQVRIFCGRGAGTSRVAGV